MLSIQQCRKYLDNCPYTEKEIENVRDSLYQIAELLVNKYIEKKENKRDRERGALRNG